ncbi:MAG TPA: hypothetical protein VIA62_17940 [Thermoanaerobaculia bacterium]|jgi:hypothetical protein|nr:hypothetical protein [Thermoanaerobaculia bacterium]
MTSHVSTEDLSAYLDSELGLAEVRPLEAHCAACAECGARLSSLRRVAHGLGGARRAELPAALRQQIRRQVQTAPPARGLRPALEWLRVLLFPVGPTLRTSAAMGLALMVALFAANHGVGDGFLRDEPRPRPEVETFMGEPPSVLPTTSEVAGRKFVWTDAGWVQRGLEWKTPETLLDAHSPQGRALLTRYSDLRFLLADGSSVVLRYNLETVEIRSTPPVTRVLGFTPHPREGRAHVRAVSA